MIDQLTTISINRTDHRQLNAWKVHPREAIKDVVKRMVEQERERRKARARLPGVRRRSRGRAGRSSLAP